MPESPASEPIDRASQPSASLMLTSDISTHAKPRVYLTSDVAGIGGTIKQRPEDFLVEEIPQYDPCGSGEHIYLFVEKRDLSTFEMIDVVAQHFGVRRNAVGYAGLKDKRAITRQVVSVHLPGKKIEDYPMLTHERVGVLWADYHTNKLRTGHLRGNRFSVRIRGTEATNARAAHRVLSRLAKVGVPNRIGEQRFGILEANHLVGRALVQGDFDQAIKHFLGPSPFHAQHSSGSREAFARGDWRTALIENPRHARAEAIALRALIRGWSPREAMLAVDESTRRFMLSAFQSAVFNAVLDERLERATLGVLVEGDLAFKHDNRAVFAVDAGVLATTEAQARLDRFEISPSGPMWSARMIRCGPQVDAIEALALAHFGVSVGELSRFEAAAPGVLEGARRPLRVPVIDPLVEGGVDEHGPYVRCAFELPRGSFATVVLREIVKPRDGDVPDDDQPDPTRTA